MLTILAEFGLKPRWLSGLTQAGKLKTDQSPKRALKIPRAERYRLQLFLSFQLVRKKAPCHLRSDYDLIHVVNVKFEHTRAELATPTYKQHFSVWQKSNCQQPVGLFNVGVASSALQLLTHRSKTCDFFATKRVQN